MELFDKIRKGIFFMSLCFFCLGQVTAQNEAKIGTTEYPTLEEAVAAGKYVVILRHQSNGVVYFKFFVFLQRTFSKPVTGEAFAYLGSLIMSSFF